MVDRQGANAGSCLTQEQLELFANLDTFNPEEKEQIMAHLHQCATCYARAYQERRNWMVKNGRKITNYRHYQYG